MPGLVLDAGIKLDVFRQNQVLVAKGQGPGQGVFQFAHIAGPVMAHDLFQRAPADFGNGPGHALFAGGDGFSHEVDHQGRDVLLAPAQRRGLDGDDGQAVVKVVAEGAVLPVPAQFGVGGGDDPGVEGHVVVRAQGADAPGGEGAEQGLLHFGRGVAHLVQHQGAALGGQKSPLARLLGFGERALDVPEQGVHEQGLVQRAAVDGDERPVGAVAQAVNGFGNQFLAGARLAHDEHVGQNLGGLLDLAIEGLHGQGGAHQAADRQIRRIG